MSPPTYIPPEFEKMFRAYNELDHDEKKELLLGAADAFYRRDQDNNGTYYMDLSPLVGIKKEQE